MKAAWFALALLSAVAHADPVRLRFASVAPEGTSWAREFAALTREVAAATQGEVQLKFYLGGVAGDELTVLDRIRRGQLDGSAAAINCELLAPSFRVAHLLGLFRSRDEFRHVLGKLRQRLYKEFQAAGFAGLGLGNFGSVMLFSRYPVRNMAELRQHRYWVWKLDDVWTRFLPLMGVNGVPLDLPEAARAYEDKRTDGFFSVPMGALAFQWSAQTRYFSDMHMAAVPGCLIVAQRALDALPIVHQQALRAAGARMEVRFEEIGQREDAALVGGLFERQGLTRVHADANFRTEFFEAARLARERIGAELVAPELIQQVLSWLGDYRADHPLDSDGPAARPAVSR
jgi:TRAP-type transport system periplasmic protein